MRVFSSRMPLARPFRPLRGLVLTRASGSDSPHLTGHLADLDVFRGLAILAVMLMHAAALTPGMAATGNLAVLFARGSAGVQLFFLLSGILISRSWRRLSGCPHAMRIFYAKRAAKIVPLYLLFLLINIGIYLLFAFALHHERPFVNFVDAENLTFGNLVTHLLFLQGMVPSALHSLVDGSWSIVNEVYFYAIFPLLFRFCRDLKSIACAYAISLVLGVGFSVLITKSTANVNNIAYYNFISQLPVFLLGIAVGRIMENKGFTAIMRRYAVPAVAIMVIFGIGMIKGNPQPIGMHNVYGVIFAVAILAGHALPPWFRAGGVRRVLIALGVQCYSLFYIHLLVLKVLWYFEKRSDVSAYTLPLLLCNVVVGLGVAVVLSNWIFDPIDRYFVKRVGRAIAAHTRAPRALPHPVVP